MLQLFTVNLLTQRGRTFGKGGLISTVFVAIMGAFCIVGSDDNPIDEWIIPAALKFESIGIPKSALSE